MLKSLITKEYLSRGLFPLDNEDNQETFSTEYNQELRSQTIEFFKRTIVYFVYAAAITFLISIAFALFLHPRVENLVPELKGNLQEYQITVIEDNKTITYDKGEY